MLTAGDAQLILHTPLALLCRVVGSFRSSEPLPHQTGSAGPQGNKIARGSFKAAGGACSLSLQMNQ